MVLVLATHVASPAGWPNPHLFLALTYMPLLGQVCVLQNSWEVMYERTLWVQVLET